jgi:hypothetical protein
MIDVYAIGTTLKLTDLVTPHLLKMSEQFAKIDALALQVNKRLQKMGAEAAGMRNLASASQRLDASLKNVSNQALLVERNLGAMKLAIPTGGLGLETELVRANAEAAALERRLLSMRGMGRIPGGLLPPGGGGGGGGGGAGGHGGRRGGHIHGGNMHVGPHGFGIGGVGMGMASDMLVPLAAAGAAIYVGHKFYEASKDYEMAMTRFRTLNLGDKVNQDADKFASGTTQFGVSMTERLTMLRDMHEIMGNYEEAKAVTPLFSRMLAANKGVFGEAGNKFDEKTFQALGKVIEMRGGTSSESAMYEQANMAQKVVTGSAGLVNPTDMLAFAKTGGVATRLLSNKAFYEESAPMIQEMGGSRFGTALMSAHQNLAMGRGTVQAMKEAVRLGIIDSKMVEYTKIGTLKRVLPGALKDSGLYDTSKYQYLLKDLIPAIRQQGVVGPGNKMVFGNDITDNMIVNELNTIFSQRTASNAFAQMYLQRNKIDKNVAVTEGAMGIDGLEKEFKKSPSGAEAEFDAAWTDFKTQFGKTMLPAITNMLTMGASILRTIAGVASNPMTASQAQIDQVPQAEHKVVGPWGALTPYMPSWMPGAGKGSDTHAAQSVAPTSGGDKTVHTTINIDGRKVAHAVTPYISGPLGSGLYTGGVDQSLGLQLPGLK